MPRFWPTALMLLLFAIIGLGWSLVRVGIIDPQGQWFGSWPLSGAEDCRTKLFPNGSFEMECKKPSTYAGAGTWVEDGVHIRFQFTFLVKDGRKLDLKLLVVKTDGVRNGMSIGGPGEAGEPHCWRRAAP